MKASFVVDAKGARKRLDLFVAEAWVEREGPGSATRGAVQRWIDAGRVLVDGKPAKASHKLAEGQTVEVDPPPPLPTAATPDASVRFEVLYEDAHLLVIDKPAGLVVHPARGHATGTLVNGLLARDGFAIDSDDEDDEAQARPGIVHRLDKGTSGVMVVAKDERTREGLKALFEAHDIDRAYLAVTVGATRAATIDTLHGRHPTDRLRFSTRVTRGKRAITHVEVIEALSGGACTLVRCRLETGRTHQIRVHLAEVARTPIVGDPVYGGRPKDERVRAIGEALGRQALHAAVLGFKHPITGETLRFETAPPADMAGAIERLRAGE